MCKKRKYISVCKLYNFDVDDPFFENVFSFFLLSLCSRFYSSAGVDHSCLAKGVTSASLKDLSNVRTLKKVRRCLGRTEPSAFYRVCVAPPPAAHKSCQKAAPIGSRSHLFLLLLALLTTRSEVSWYLLICIVLLIAVVSFLDIYRFVLSVYLLLLSLPLAVKQATSKDIRDS